MQSEVLCLCSSLLVFRHRLGERSRMIMLSLPSKFRTSGRTWRIPNTKYGSELSHPLCCSRTGSMCCYGLCSPHWTSGPSSGGRLSICLRRAFTGIRNVRSPGKPKNCEYIAIIRSSPAMWNGTCPALGSHPGDGSGASCITQGRLEPCKIAPSKKRRKCVLVCVVS